MGPIARPERQILLCHPVMLVAEALRALIMIYRPGSNVRLAGSLEEAVSILGAADGGMGIVLLYTPRGSEGQSAVVAIREAAPEARIVLIADRVDGTLVDEASRHGVSGLVSPDTSGAQLDEILRRVAAGGICVPSGVAGGAARAPRPAARPEGAAAGLSPRQTDVLRLLMQGASNKTVARELGLGENTIKTHVKQIMRRLGVKNRTEAVPMAIRLGV